MIGGPYAILIAALTALALAVGSYFYGRSDGRALERAVWAGQQNSDLRTANQALDAAHRQARTKEQDAAKKVAAVSSAYQKDLANANRAKTLAMDALRASGGGLRVAVTGCEANTSGTAEAPAAAPGRNGGTTTGLLDESATAFFVSEASRADEVTLQLRSCQAVIRADRGD